MSITSVKQGARKPVFGNDMVVSGGFSGRVRGVVTVLALSLVACATTKSSDQALREECREDLRADERCVDVLTGSTDDREAEEEVLRAEEDRERDAFRARLTKLRRAEERRQAERARTATVAQNEDWEEEDDAAWLDILRSSSEEDDVDDGGSSVRALKAAPAKPPPKPERRSITIEAPPPRVIDNGAPTPTTYLHGARCLLRADLALIRQTLETAKKNKTRDDIVGSLALVILDTEGLLETVEAALAKKPVVEAPLCSSGDVRSMVTLLRELVGPRPEATEAGDAYGRGLARLKNELDKRAGSTGSR